MPSFSADLGKRQTGNYSHSGLEYTHQYQPSNMWNKGWHCHVSLSYNT